MTILDYMETGLECLHTLLVWIKVNQELILIAVGVIGAAWGLWQSARAKAAQNALGASTTGFLTVAGQPPTPDPKGAALALSGGLGMYARAFYRRALAEAEQKLKGETK